MVKSTVFNSLLVCYQSTHLLTQIRLRVMFLPGVSIVRPMMSHDVRFYMKYSTVFSTVNTIIQTRIVLRVLPDNQKNFTQSQEIENLNFNPLFPTLKCKNYSFADAQTVARVFIYNSKHIVMVSLSYFENQLWKAYQTYNKTIKAWFHRVLSDSASCAIFGDSTGSSYG